MEKNSDIWDRRGKFHISSIVMRTSPELVQKVMAKVIVIRCELLALEDVFVYDALSTHFDITEIGGTKPIYNIIIHKENNMDSYVSFRRQD